MTYTLILAEKPSAAKRIAWALSAGNLKANASKKVKYYEFEVNKKKYVVASAVGHLFSLAQKKRTSKYPMFEIEWKPMYEVNKSAAFSKPYADLIKKLAKNATDFIASTDLDREGELIALNCLRFLCNTNDAKRMRFSTLTSVDLKKAFQNIAPSLDWGFANAGETRHFLDFYYGISLSKAASAAITGAINRYQTLSMGRVQGPTLSILAEREKEILSFKPEPFWQIFIKIKNKYQAVHVENKFFKKPEDIFAKIKDEDAKVKNLTKTEFNQLPPTPFDLTTLQTEAFRCFRISPKQTLSIAQELYTRALISYPRTSSQQLPPSIGYKTILNKLAKQEFFKDLVSKIKQLKPMQGKKTDPAHPAIYPTGEFPKALDKQQLAIYGLIVKRFISCFGEPAIKETTTVIFDIKGEEFVLKGARTLKQAWSSIDPFQKAHPHSLKYVSIN